MKNVFNYKSPPSLFSTALFTVRLYLINEHYLSHLSALENIGEAYW
jgi:hypothetical protein